MVELRALEELVVGKILPNVHSLHTGNSFIGIVGLEEALLRAGAAPVVVLDALHCSAVSTDEECSPRFL